MRGRLQAFGVKRIQRGRYLGRRDGPAGIRLHGIINRHHLFPQPPFHARLALLQRP
jgi:hypothetical protein